MKKIELLIEDIVTKYESGMTQEEIAKEYGVSNFTISKRLSEYYKSNGTPKPQHTKKIELPIEDIAKKYESVKTLKQIAEEYSVSESTIIRKLNEYYEESKPKPKNSKIELSIEEIVRKYESGKTVIQISKEYGVSQRTIYRRLTEYDKNNGVSKKIELPTEDIVKKYESGKTVIQISKEYGVSRKTIYRRLTEYDKNNGVSKKIELPTEDIVKKYESSKTLKQIAEEYSVSESTISRKLNEYYNKRQELQKPDHRKKGKKIKNTIDIEENGYTTVKQQKDEINIGKYKLVRTLGNEKMKEMILKLIKTRNATDEQIQKIAEFYGVEMEKIENINEER